LRRAWIERHGVPKALYTNCKSVYVSEPTAGSPQAKGRVERAHGTHQDRLVKKLRLAGVTGYEQANTFLERNYLADHNRRFTHLAASDADFHRERPTRAGLDTIFCLEQDRVLSLDWVVSYEGKLLQSERQSRRYAPAKSRVQVRENEAGELHIEYRGRRLNFIEIAHRPRRAHPPEVVFPASREHNQAPKEHPWRQSYKQMRTPAAAF